MSRKYPKTSRVRKSSKGRRGRGRPRRIEQQALAQGREVQLPLDVESLLEMTREALSRFAVEMGLKVAQCLLADEVTQRCGQRHERVAGRQATRFGHQPGFITIAGQKVSIDKPRVRYTDGRGEAELERYQLLQSPEALPQAALDHLVNGVSTRRYERVVQLASAGFGVKRSSVSRGFVRATAAQVAQLAERRFDDERFAVIFIDAQPYAGEMLVVALGITTFGTKRLLGLRQGATENATVVTSLLEELRERGVRTDLPTLFVLDGAKALQAAVVRVWGKFAVVQRCQVHKRRNVAAHLPEKHHDELYARLHAAYQEMNATQARGSACGHREMAPHHQSGGRHQPRRRTRRDTHRRAARRPRATSQDACHHEPHRKRLQRGRERHPSRQTLARRRHAPAVVRRRTPRCRTTLQPHQGSQTHAPTPRRSRSTHPTHIP